MMLVLNKVTILISYKLKNSSTYPAHKYNNTIVKVQRQQQQYRFEYSTTEGLMLYRVEYSKLVRMKDDL